MLSDNIRKYRKINHMSQDELADKLKVTRQSISLWETGQTQPSIDNIVALAKLFDISTDNLLSDDEPEMASVYDVSTKTSNDKPSRKKTRIVVLVVCFLLVAILSGTILLFDAGVINVKNDDKTSSLTAQSTSSINETTSSPAESKSSPAESKSSPAESKSSPVESKSSSVKSKSSSVESTNSMSADDNQSSASKEAQVAIGTPNTDKEKNIYGYLKDFIIQNGTINGDYCYYSKTADNYGGYQSEDFSLYYWGDTDKIEFCLHSVLDDTFSINFYLYVPKKHTGNYEYISSYYYRDNGESLYEAKGTIVASEFTNNYPLNCSEYIGSTDKQNDFMEMSRVGICDLINCLEEFIKAEKIEYSFSDFGFTNF